MSHPAYQIGERAWDHAAMLCFDAGLFDVDEAGHGVLTTEGWHVLWRLDLEARTRRSGDEAAATADVPLPENPMEAMERPDAEYEFREDFGRWVLRDFEWSAEVD